MFHFDAILPSAATALFSALQGGVRVRVRVRVRVWVTV